ncbi:MAG: ABC transporter permease, partial [Planctomycetota bacterium]
MSTLDRKLRRDLSRSRATLAAIIVVIVVGVACFVGLASAYVNLERSYRSYYAACRMADFWVLVEKAPLPVVRGLTEVPGVAEIRARIVFEATIDLPDVPRPLTGRVLSLPARPAPVLNDIVLRRGSYFTDEHFAQVIVNDAFARARNIEPGDVIHVLLDGRRQRLYVVGTAISSEFVYQLAPGSFIPEPGNY